MIWGSPYDQDHPTTHVIVSVVATQKPCKKQMCTIQWRMLKHNTMPLYIGGCILVPACEPKHGPTFVVNL